MFNYFTQIKNLHNILWVFSPDYDRLGLLKYYPGGGFVDIVALDVYADDPVGVPLAYILCEFRQCPLFYIVRYPWIS